MSLYQQIQLTLPGLLYQHQDIAPIISCFQLKIIIKEALNPEYGYIVKVAFLLALSIFSISTSPGNAR